MGFDVLSYAIGLQAGKGNGGGSNAIVKKIRVQVPNTTTRKMTVTHNLGVVPDLVIATAFSMYGKQTFDASSKATFQCIGTGVPIGNLLGTDETGYFNERWSIADDTIRVEGVNRSITYKNPAYGVFVHDATETSVTFSSGTLNTYLFNGYWDVWIFSGLV